MAEPRKVPFVTLSAFAAGPASEPRKRRHEDEAGITLDGNTAAGSPTTGAGGGGLFGKARDGDNGEPRGITVRLNLCLSEPSDHASAEFNYSELVQSIQGKKVSPPEALTPACDPNDPLADQDKERREVEALAKRFESKYGSSGKKKRKDRMQDLIDIGFGYDESDPFIDNSEAYDELVPASLTTKLGGFYINTGTLQFRAASESEGEEGGKDGKGSTVSCDGEEQVIKKRKRKDASSAEEKKPRKTKVPKQGVSSLNIHRPEKKKRKKLMKDSLYLAAMLRRFTREKEEMRKKTPPSGVQPPGPAPNAPRPNHALPNSQLHPHPHPAHNDISMADLTADPAVMSLLGSTSESELQDILEDLDFSLLDSAPQASSPAHRENGLLGAGGGGPGPKVGAGAAGRGVVAGGGLLTPPPLPDGLPAPLIKRIEDLRAASRQFDQEGRKKFFTLDMNNILLDIELQVQEQPAEVRAAVYSHLEAFVPCNKEALLKRLKKLSLNIQDDRLRTPLLKLKLAVCGVMPEQIARYNMDCMAKAAKQQSEEGEKNGSEEEDEEKPGKRVMGPRKKFVWDDRLRTLLCNLVRVKLGCYELESQCSLSVEDYLKAFMENEVKPLWPKGWMQARMLFKESRSVHSHLTGNLAKRKIVPTQKPRTKEGGWVRMATPTSSALATPSPAPCPAPAARRPPSSPSETICLSDSLDDELMAPSLDSISHTLALLGSVAKGLVQNDSPPSPPGPAPTAPPTTPHYTSPLSHSLLGKKEGPAMSAGGVTGATTSPSSSGRGEGLGGVKAAGSLTPANRHTLSAVHRPGIPAVNKLCLPGSPSPPKPRPPPTASPLLPPQQKPFCPPGVKPGGAPPPSGLPKNSGKASSANANCGGNAGGGVGLSSQSRMNSNPPQLNPKSPQTPRLPLCPSPGAPSKPQPHHQSNFITPMQATLTKSSHSNNPPIIKLTPRPPAPTPPPSSSPSSSPSPSASPSLPPHSRPVPIQSPHQFSPKNTGFRPPFSVPGGAAKVGPTSYSPAGGGQKGSPHSSAGASPTSSASASSPSPSPSSASHGQRQRPAGGASQGAKPVANRAPVSSVHSSPLSQVSSPGSNLLGPSPPSLPLGFGMLGGLVPVSLPFQFPSLLNFSPPGVPGGSGLGGAAAGNNSGYSLAQSEYLLKSLQAGSQSALPPHLQLAFSDANQTQGGDMKRKSH
ncbi:hypothetical protein GJAV_G00144570 [Gymnothorax javanicus]|nr:hypothetical protein GJAV_G00144570 [Gymnothorax javanicus]